MNNASHLLFASIAEPGFYVEERVVLRPSTRMNLMDYILLPMRGGPTPNEAEDLHGDAFWFSDKVVRAGDFVLVYTKAGADYSFTESNGRDVHVFYWGKDKPVWRPPATAVAILKVSDWAFYEVEESQIRKAG